MSQNQTNLWNSSFIPLAAHRFSIYNQPAQHRVNCESWDVSITWEILFYEAKNDDETLKTEFSLSTHGKTEV